MTPLERKLPFRIIDFTGSFQMMSWKRDQHSWLLTLLDKTGAHEYCLCGSEIAKQYLSVFP